LGAGELLLGWAAGVSRADLDGLGSVGAFAMSKGGPGAEAGLERGLEAGFDVRFSDADADADRPAQESYDW
jgi:hypothetical protein